MIQLKKAMTSSLGKKFFMALSGLGLVVFIILHLLGNLSLYQATGAGFNAYAAALDNLGKFKEMAEWGLVALFFLHIATAFYLTVKNRAAGMDEGVGATGARRYKVWSSKSKGVADRSGPTEAQPSGLASRSMIVTGSVVFGFLILHIWQMHFGPGVAEGYVTQVHGEQARDLHRLVVETFHNPLYVLIYVGCISFLGVHLRHGFWSAFQSLGAMNPRISGPIHCLGLALAFLLAAGFIFIPICIYFGLAGAGAALGG